jgi:hypothetical protein
MESQITYIPPHLSGGRFFVIEPIHGDFPEAPNCRHDTTNEKEEHEREDSSDVSSEPIS